MEKQAPKTGSNMHQIKKIRALYLVNFFVEFDKNHKMQSVFNFVHVYVLFKAIQVKVLFLILSLIFLADFFSIGNNKNLQSMIY